MTWDAGVLSRAQREFVEAHVDSPTVIANHSWGQLDTVVLQVASGDATIVVKAAGPDNHHLLRDITAHEGFTGPLVDAGITAPCIASDRDARILLLDWMPGELAEGTAAEFEPARHRDAGRALRLLHEQGARIEPEWATRVVAAADAWLEKEHRIDADTVYRVRAQFARYPMHPRVLVPSQGDYQPRNWLIDNGELRVIDFGRFDWRPVADDFGRLAAQQWRTHPELRDAFIDGYGSDPTADPAWHFDLLYGGVSTAVWAYSVGDETFEQQGHRMIAEALHALGSDG